MDPSAIIHSIISLARQYPIVAAAALIVLLYVAWRSTRFVMGVLALIAILALIWYFIMDLGAIGKASKKQGFEKTDKQIEQVR